MKVKKKDVKKMKSQIAKENIDFFFNLLKSRKNKEFDAQYIREIKKLSEGFNFRLTKEQKLLFCKKCSLFFDKNNLQIIRIDSKNFTKNYTCPRCNFTRRFCLKNF